MDSNELKFLLTLLGCPGYRSSLSHTSFKSFKNKEKLAIDLGARSLVDFSRDIAAVKIEPPGRALLKLDSSQRAIDPLELKLLEKLAKASREITPGEIKVSSIKAGERDSILQRLSERGLIKAETKIDRTKAEVWLTQRGQEYLRNEYNPSGNTTITLDLLHNYLRFLRKSIDVELDGQPQEDTSGTTDEQVHKLADEEILQIIRDLDQYLGTENHLPIFHLRQKLKPLLSRDELDETLFRLQQNERIQLRVLEDHSAYTLEQVDAGISQDTDKLLFFIFVK